MEQKQLLKWRQDIKKDFYTDFDTNTDEGRIEVNVRFVYLIDESQSSTEVDNSEGEADPKPSNDKTNRTLLVSADVTKEVRKSFISRIIRTFSVKRANEYEFKHFNLIENNDKTFYSCSPDLFSNLRKGIERLRTIEMADSLYDMKSLKNVLGIMIELIDRVSGDQPKVTYAFVAINKFNSLRMNSINSGFIAKALKKMMTMFWRTLLKKLMIRIYFLALETRLILFM
ncbi:hypothetical protein ETB91_09790 [Lacticaseibacillus rhamnosus]|uniref:hypothetical protein n=1 Tax=Lacticaseibacillus rhamnosus TaxID=47715 RepID=UPI001013C682|nr:hypothetical protein [Lacticaseibacillus rhamnosus]MCZ2733637.1 hypothetical protein [Lacticaseibacillus rhamnosus]MCZ2736319.1 hypothetical protein [Lacticaseibacillus rhamnosus]MCZ2742607.1 hypothetical protein [Lacticaseibacillus rhamnosus]MCZ2745350.1 hypothetical protein [Lacticaseibacillus rhamnosus]MCZ2748085.1 hypothetical protein [Lacticaseibacillus rhamnosus]